MNDVSADREQVGRTLNAYGVLVREANGTPKASGNGGDGGITG